MAAQTLKCRKKTETTQWNEKSFDITDKSSTTLALLEVWTLLNASLRPAHSWVYVAMDTEKRHVAAIVLLVHNMPLCAGKFCCGVNRLSLQHDTWNSAGVYLCVIKQGPYDFKFQCRSHRAHHCSCKLSPLKHNEPISTSCAPTCALSLMKHTSGAYTPRGLSLCSTST